MGDCPEQWREDSDPSQPPIMVHRKDVTQALQRWTQASMHLLFNKFGRRMTSNEALTQVQSMGFLTAEEHAILATEAHEHAVGIWSWHFQTMLKVQKSKVGMIPIQRWDAYVNDAM